MIVNKIPTRGCVRLKHAVRSLWLNSLLTAVVLYRKLSTVGCTGDPMCWHRWHTGDVTSESSWWCHQWVISDKIGGGGEWSKLFLCLKTKQRRNNRRCVSTKSMPMCVWTYYVYFLLLWIMCVCVCVFKNVFKSGHLHKFSPSFGLQSVAAKLLVVLPSKLA